MNSIKCRPTGTALRRSALTAAAIGMTMAMTACSSAANEQAVEVNPNGIADAKAAVTQAMVPPAFALTDADAFDAAGAKGKSLWIIDINSAIDLVQVSDEATKQALDLVGASVTTFDGKGSASEYARGIQEAINNKADAIALYAIDPHIVAGPVASAQAAGIPVIAVQYADPGTPLPANVAAGATYSYSENGKTMANFITADANGDAAGVLVISSSDVRNSKDLLSGFNSTIAANCPACTVYHNDVSVADWQTKISTEVNSQLNSHPDIKYVVPIYDGMATFAIPGIKSSGRDDVKVVTGDASRAIMKYLGAGDTVVAEVGTPQAWEGWAIADQFLRLVTGNEPLADQQVGSRLFTGENVGTLDLDAPQGDWFEADYENGYKKLWKLN